MNRSSKSHYWKTPSLVAGMAVAVCFVAVAGATPSLPDPGEEPWTLPTWVANDQIIQGTFSNGASPSPEDVRIRYRINDGEAQDATLLDSESLPGTINFKLPKLDYETFGTIYVWAENAKSGESNSGVRTVAVADWHEFDITGQTAVEMLFPMQSWNMQVRFTPCCLILGGYLRVERVPINPAKSSEGLPETLASHFLHLAPDPTVVATSGLNADIEIDSDSALADSPQNVTVYTWFKDKWIPVLGATLHAETNTIRFKALEGGYFVLASNSGSQD